ncbi:putative carboxylesterase [Helianthus anomalus]
MEFATTAKTRKSLSLPWKTRIIYWLMETAIDLVTRKDGTVNRRLHKLVDFRIPPSSKPVNGVKTYDVVVDLTRNLWFRDLSPHSTLKKIYLLWCSFTQVLILSSPGREAIRRCLPRDNWM